MKPNAQSATAPPIRPASRVEGQRPYQPPDRNGPDRLWLDLNEGAPDPDLLIAASAALTADALCRYPNPAPLEAEIADAWSIDPGRVVVTNGGDDAIDRVCRAVINPGDLAVLHTPTFEMIQRSVCLAGGKVCRCPWNGGDFPIAPFRTALTGARLAALVTPNNPTGGAIPTPDLLELVDAAANAGAIALVDLAYVEFTDADPTAALIARPNVVVVRTFSKAFGLAGLRVGYAITSAEIAPWMRTVGGPFPVSGVSLALAAEAWRRRDDRQPFIERVRAQRDGLTALLRSRGVDVAPSDANFVTARLADPTILADALAQRGVAIRVWSPDSPLADRIRISLPGDDDAFERLRAALLESLLTQESRS